MTDSLSGKLNLKINNYPIILGKALDAAQLHSQGFHKVGFFARLLLRPEKGELLYLSKNSVISYLSGDDCIIRPVMDQKHKKRALLGTIAYLWYKNNRLSKVGFQIIQSTEYVAVTLFEELEKKVVEAIASPPHSSQNQRVWEVNNQKLILVFPNNHKYGYIHLVDSE